MGHTAALLFGQGLHLKLVSDLLGHPRVGITLGPYSQVTPDLQQQTLARWTACSAKTRTRGRARISQDGSAREFSWLYFGRYCGKASIRRRGTGRSESMEGWPSG